MAGKRTNTASLPKMSFTLPSGPITMWFPGARPDGALAPATPAKTPATAAAAPTTATMVDGETLAHVSVSAIPAGSGWAAPPHWHETHTENFRVTRGYALIRLRGGHRIMGPEDGPVEIPPYTVHGFGRADVGGTAADGAWAEWEAARGGGAEKEAAGVRFGAWRREEVFVEEWTMPADGQKEVFFRNLFSYYKDHLQAAATSTGLAFVLALPGLMLGAPKMLYAMARLDNYFLILDNRLGLTSDGELTGLSLALMHSFNALLIPVGKALGWRFWWAEYTPATLLSVAKAMEQR